MKRKTVFTAKVSHPTLNKVLERKRLFELIDGELSAPVTWVSGPAGCGKTTLISSYAEFHRRPCFWYQIDTGDADPATFFHYLGLAARKASPRSRKPLPDFSLEYLPALPVFTRRFFEALYDKLSPSTLMVFDDFHNLPQDAVTHELMLLALSIVPAHLNIAVVSRRVPPKAFTGLIARDIMKSLTGLDLRLDLEESAAIIQMRSKGGVSDDIVSQIHQTTDGWVSGITLWMEAARNRSVYPLEGERAPEEIFNYFAGELFDRADEKLRDFFLSTAFLPQMNINTAGEISGHPGAKLILADLCRNNYFITKHYHPQVSYQYHPLFKKFLLAQAQDVYSVDKVGALMIRAGKILDETGDLEASAHMFISARANDLLVNLIFKNAQPLLGKGRNRLVLDWIGSLPEKVVSGNPWLIFWQAAAAVMIDPNQSCLLFEAAFDMFSSRKDSIGRLLSWAGILDAKVMTFGSFTIFDKWIAVFEDLRDELDIIPDPAIRSVVAGSIFKALVLRKPQDPDIEKWAQQAVLPGNDPTVLNHNAWIYLILHAYYMSPKIDVKKADEIVTRLMKICNHPSCGPMAKMLAGYTQIVFFQFKGEVENALDAVSRFTSLSKDCGFVLFDILFKCHEAAVLLDDNRLQAAEDLLDSMFLSLDPERPWEVCVYYLQKSRLCAIKKEYGQALANADSAIEQADKVGSQYISLVCLIQKVYALYAKGQKPEAKKLLAYYFELSKASFSDMDQFNGLMMKAYFELDEEDDISGLKTLRSAMAIGEKHGLLNVFHDQPQVTAFLCAKALEEGIAPQYAQRIVKKRGFLPDQRFAHLGNWPWKIKVFSFGGFRIEVNGTALTSNRKMQKKPLEMLKVLVAMGGDQVHEDRISDALWPETEGHKAHTAFTTTLHRLRKLLKTPRAIHVNGRRVTLDRRYCWVDTWAFTSLIEKADTIKWHQSRVDDFNKMTNARKAVQLYKDRFLRGEEWDPNIISMADRLQLMFQKGVLITGQYFEAARQWRNALDCYEASMDKNYFSEVVFNSVIRCHHALGQHELAHVTYQLYKKKLAITWGEYSLPAFDSIWRALDRRA